MVNSELAAMYGIEKKYLIRLLKEILRDSLKS